MPTDDMPTRELDLAPLTAEPTRDEVRAYRAAAKASGAAWASIQPGQLLGLAVLLPFAGLFLVMGGGMAAMVGRVLGRDLDLTTVGFVVIPLVVLVVGVVAVLRSGRRWARWARLDRFARANAMRFSPADPAPGYPGSVFGLGTDRQVIEHFANADGRVFDLGNYRYTTGSGKSRTTHRWGFLAFKLDRRLPHMVLDSKANNGLFGGTNLPATFSRDQVLSLEGDFDTHFTLYCPRQYERDALYVFTPDLMALLIDEAAPFDVEIVDDWMFVYRATEFEMAAPSTFQRLFRIMGTVGAKTLTQTDRYVDERVGDFAANLVAPQGTRLRRRTSVVGIAVIVVFVAFWLWGATGELRSLFG